MRASELSDLVYGNLYFYMLMYVLFFLLYLVLFKGSYWGIFDRMFFTVINEIGGAFCVWLLYYMNSLKPEYGWSFIFTDAALIVGLFFSRYLPTLHMPGKHDDPTKLVSQKKITEYDVFGFVVGSTYILLEIVSIMTVGIVLINDTGNHASAYNDHGILRAFIASFRFLMIAVLFYKKIVLNKNWSPLDLICFVVLLFGVLTSGAKSSILSFVFVYFMISYPLIRIGKVKKLKISLPLVFVLGAFPVIVIAVSTGAGATTALQQVYVRLLASGDIFLLGYQEGVFNFITEKSFFKYAFYPGWGSVLKNLGFQITPPRPIGGYIFEYYTAQTSGGGPNARHNYLGYYFFGFYGSIAYSFLIGLIVGFVRNSFKFTNPLKISYYAYFAFLIFAYFMPYLIDDLLLFGNSIFWTLFFLGFSVILTKLVYSVITIVAQPKVQEKLVEV